MDWGREARRDAPLALLVQVNGPAGPPDEAVLLGGAIHRFFAHRGDATRDRVRRLFHLGRTSLVIGLAVLAAFLGIGQLLGSQTGIGGAGEVVRESLSIAGWVAMWRPLEIFLYDWWPIRAEAKLYDRLAAMPIRIQYVPGSGSR